MTPTKREIQVLSMLAEGHSTKEISESLYISTHTVETHKRNLRSKLQAKNIAHLAVIAERHGWTGYPFDLATAGQNA